MVKPNLTRKKRDKRKEKTRKQKYKYSGGSQGTIPPTNEGKANRQAAQENLEVNPVVEEGDKKLEKTKGIFLKIKELLGSTRLFVDKIYASAERDLYEADYKLIKSIERLKIDKEIAQNKKKEIIESLTSMIGIKKSLYIIINILKIYSEQYKEGEKRIKEFIENLEERIKEINEILEIIKKLNGKKVIDEIEEKVIDEIEQLILKKLKTEELEIKNKIQQQEFWKLNRELDWLRKKKLYEEKNINVNHPEIKSLSAAQEEVEKSMKELDRELEFLDTEKNISLTKEVEEIRKQLELLKADANVLKSVEDTLAENDKNGNYGEDLYRLLYGENSSETTPDTLSETTPASEPAPESRAEEELEPATPTKTTLEPAAPASGDGTEIRNGTTSPNSKQIQEKPGEKKSQNPINFFAPVLLIVLIGFVSVN